MAHPGDDWGRTGSAPWEKPTLRLAGRRSIFVAWPPTARCEVCGAAGPDGYVGPAVGDQVHFPDPTTHFTCEPCARAGLGLRPGELADERCIIPGCVSDEHANKVVVSSADLPPDANQVDIVAYMSSAGGYRARGWRVVGATFDPSGPRPANGHAWRVIITPARQLW